MRLEYMNPIYLVRDVEKRLIFILSFASSWIFIRSSGESWISVYYESITQILINSSQASPSSYRLLSPMILAGIQSFTGSGVAGFKWALFIFCGVGLFFSAIMVYLAIKKFTTQNALAHALAYLIIFQIGLIDHYPHPWSIIETGFLIACMFSAVSRKFIVFFILILLAVVNRETAIIYSVMYLLFNHDTKKNISLGVFIILSSVVCYAMIRFVFIGNGPHQITMEEVFRVNLLPHNVGIFAIPAVIMFLSAVTSIASFDNQSRPAPDTISKVKVGIIAALYAMACFIFAIWKEFRVFLPLYPLLVIMLSPVVFSCEANKAKASLNNPLKAT